MIICSLKLKQTDDEEVQTGFFKLSMIFAACNLTLSVLLLVSVLKVIKHLLIILLNINYLYFRKIKNMHFCMPC